METHCFTLHMHVYVISIDRAYKNFVVYLWRPYYIKKPLDIIHHHRIHHFQQLDARAASSTKLVRLNWNEHVKYVT